MTITVTAAPIAIASTDISTSTGTAAITMTGATASNGTSVWSGGTGTWSQNSGDPALATFTPTNSNGSFVSTLSVTGTGGCSSIIATSTTRKLGWGASSGSWTGMTSTDWTLASNWSDNTIPGIGTDVTIPDTTLLLNGVVTIGAAAMCRNLTIGLGGELTILGSNNLDIHGNWINNGTFTAGSSTVTLNGASAQTIDGNNTFNNLAINNTTVPLTSATITLNNAATVNGNLTLTRGYIVSTPTFLLTLTSAATSTVGSASSFVSGPIKKLAIPVSGSFTFPIGKGAQWMRAAVSSVGFDASDFQAEYFPAGYGSYGLTAPLNNVSAIEYWQIDKTRLTTNAKVTLFWEDASASGISNCSTLTVAHWNSNTSLWEKFTSTASGTCSGSGSGSIITNFASTSFSPFTFGTRSNPLPIELISFDAKCNNGKVNINWSTATENNNEYFTLERSTDGINFNAIKIIKGSGNSSSVKYYSATDIDALTGSTLYYRLKQTDFDGKFEYFNIVAVSCTDIKLSNINIYPNPAITLLNVSFKDVEENTIIRIVSMDGKVMKTITSNVKGLNEINISDLADGVYLLQVQSATVNQTFRWVKTK